MHQGHDLSSLLVATINGSIHYTSIIGVGQGKVSSFMFDAKELQKS